MKRLFLIRHAHAHPAAAGLPDHDRELDERGRSEGLEMGRRLRQRGVMPDRLVFSSAARARMTAQLLAAGMDVQPERLMKDERIYASSSMNLLYLVRSLEDSLACVMVVGHNPEMTELARRFSAGMPDLPTCAVVEFDFKAAAWSEVGSVPRLPAATIRHRGAAAGRDGPGICMKAEAPGQPILVLNCGSSSIKFALFDAAVTPLPRQPVWRGKVDGIAGPDATYTATGVSSEPLSLDEARPYHAALELIRIRASARLDGRALAGVAHRVVHGGTKYRLPVRVDAAILKDLESYIPLAPLHQPFALEAIEAMHRAVPGIPQVACFDTAFHHTMPQVEKMLPLPYSAWERGVRRYGFHGLSYEYQSIVLAERYGEQAAGRCIVAHLGSGASLCAMRNLKGVATTMGFSALDGLMMGTRCGSLDPGALIYLMQIERLTLEEVARVLYHESGLLGVSGVSADPRVLVTREADDERVQAALALYVRRIVREIGALTAALGGLDMLVFTAGIGENNPVIRERVCAGLEFLGVRLDAAANQAALEGGGGRISAADATVLVAVEPTNEEWIAAVHCVDRLNGARD